MDFLGHSNGEAVDEAVKKQHAVIRDWRNTSFKAGNFRLAKDFIDLNWIQSQKLLLLGLHFGRQWL